MTKFFRTLLNLEKSRLKQLKAEQKLKWRAEKGRERSINHSGRK